MFLVQVRHGGVREWVTIGTYPDRAAAARGGSKALIGPEQGGHGAVEVRVVSDVVPTRTKP